MESTALVGDHWNTSTGQVGRSNGVLILDTKSGKWRSELVAPRTVSAIVIGLLVLVVVMNSLINGAFGIHRNHYYLDGGLYYYSGRLLGSLGYIGSVRPFALWGLPYGGGSFRSLSLYVTDIWLNTVAGLAVFAAFVHLLRWHLRRAAIFLAIASICLVLQVQFGVLLGYNGIVASAQGLVSPYGAAVLVLLVLQSGLAAWLFLGSVGFERRWGISPELAAGIARSEARRSAQSQANWAGSAATPGGMPGWGGATDPGGGRGVAAPAQDWYQANERPFAYGLASDLPPDVEYATFWRRLGSLIIDQLFILFVLLPIVAGIGAGIAAAMGGDPVVGAILTVAMDSGFGAAAYVISGSSLGQTVGQQMLGVRVCQESGQRLGFWRTIGRNILSWLSTIALFVGWLAPLWSPKRQTWHDSMTHTVVIRDTTSKLANHAVKWGLIWSIAAGLALGALSGAILNAFDSAGIDFGVTTIDGNEYWNSNYDDYGDYSYDDFGD